MVKELIKKEMIIGKAFTEKESINGMALKLSCYNSKINKN